MPLAVQVLSWLTGSVMISASMVVVLGCDQANGALCVVLV
jgi:hypothetical protein